MDKYIKTKKCKICRKIGKVYFLSDRTKHRVYICDNCKSCYSEKKDSPQTKPTSDNEVSAEGTLSVKDKTGDRIKKKVLELINNINQGYNIIEKDKLRKAIGELK